MSLSLTRNERDTSPVRVNRVLTGRRGRTELHPATPVETGERAGDGLMPQMFDWIFFAIMLPFPAYLVWDFMRHR